MAADKHFNISQVKCIRNILLPVLTRKLYEGQKSLKSNILLLGHGLFANPAGSIIGRPAVWTVEVPLPALVHRGGAQLVALDTGQH